MARLTMIVAAAVGGIALAGFGLVAFDDRSGPPIIIEDPLADATIVVAVEGAVAAPGIYPLAAAARVQDALDAAGGPTADADLTGINPARRLRDEERIVVPARSAAAAIPTGGASRQLGSAATAVTDPRPAPLVDLNTAAVAELDTLPGIGPVLGQRIVDYRAANGHFRSVAELAKVEGISARMVEELRPLVSVGP